MAMVTLKGLFGGSDAICDAFLTQTYPAIAALVQEPIYYIAIIYWAVYAYKIHGGHEPVGIMLYKRAVMTAVIFASLHWSSFAKAIYLSFAGFMESTGATIMAGQPTINMLDAFYTSVGRVASTLQKAGLQSIGLVLTGYGLFILNTILLAFAVVNMLLAKFGLAIVMVLLPLFLSFFLFDASRQWGMNWISKMLNFCFIYILSMAVVRFGFLAFGDAVLEAGKAATIKEAALITVNKVSYLWIVELVLVIFMWQVKSWASALAGGAQVQGAQAFMAIASMFRGIPKK